MDLSQLLRALGLQQAYQSYQENVGQPFANVAGPFGRGLLGLEKPEYGEEQAYRTGQAVGNMPAVGAPVGAFKALAQIPGLLEAASVAPAIFIGPRARTWNKASAEAFEKLEKGGVSNKDAYLQTGTFRSPDGQLRQEISDVEASIKPVDDPYWMRYGAQRMAHGGQVGSLLQHPDLYSAYSDAAKIPYTEVLINPKLADGGGSFRYNDTGGEIAVRASGLDQARSIALHELQHAIQQKEGFARGGSPTGMVKDVDEVKSLQDKINFNFTKAIESSDEVEKKNAMQAVKEFSDQLKNFKHLQIQDQEGLYRYLSPEEAYLRLAGEAEARAVQSRMNFPQEELRKMFPLESYDVPINQLIVRGLLGQ